MVDFHSSEAVRRGKSLEDVGHKIKEDIKQTLGEYVTVNVGIGTTAFWRNRRPGCTSLTARYRNPDPPRRK